MKKIVISLICCQLLLGCFHVEAQQETMYSQYMFNTLALNPAYTGSREMLNITGLSRIQWVGINGAPISQNVSVDAQIPNKNAGLGLVLLNDRIGSTNNFGIHASYGYHVKFQDATLSFGLKLGIIQYSLQLSNGIVNQGSIADDRVFEYNGNSYVPCTGAGAYLKGEKYYVGLSIPTMYITVFGNRTQVLQNSRTPTVLMAGYSYEINDDITLKPSLLYKFVPGAPMQLDLNCNAWMYDVVGVGLGYRTGDAILGMIEVKATPDLRIGYCYDYTVSDLSKYSSGSHELMLRYRFKMLPSKYVAPSN